MQLTQDNLMPCFHTIFIASGSCQKPASENKEGKKEKAFPRAPFISLSIHHNQQQGFMITAHL